MAEDGPQRGATEMVNGMAFAVAGFLPWFRISCTYVVGVLMLLLISPVGIGGDHTAVPSHGNTLPVGHVPHHAPLVSGSWMPRNG
jgi:hypothetical protein